MREIKLRIYDTNEKRYADTKDSVYCVGVLHDNILKIGLDDTKSSYCDGLILEQSINLFDKNGVEIFVGDIVKAEHHGIVRNYQVVYLKYRYILADFCDSKYDYPTEAFSELDANDMEVVGNIHDNPELLNQANARNT